MTHPTPAEKRYAEQKEADQIFFDSLQFSLDDEALHHRLDRIAFIQEQEREEEIAEYEARIAEEDDKLENADQPAGTPSAEESGRGQHHEAGPEDGLFAVFNSSSINLIANILNLYLASKVDAHVRNECESKPGANNNTLRVTFSHDRNENRLLMRDFLDLLIALQLKNPIPLKFTKDKELHNNLQMYVGRDLLNLNDPRVRQFFKLKALEMEEKSPQHQQTRTYDTPFNMKPRPKKKSGNNDLG